MNITDDTSCKRETRRYRALSKEAARPCRVGLGMGVASKSRLPRATIAAMRETEDIIAHPEKYPGMTFEQYVAWAHSL